MMLSSVHPGDIVALECGWNAGVANELNFVVGAGRELLLVSTRPPSLWSTEINCTPHLKPIDPGLIYSIICR